MTIAFVLIQVTECLKNPMLNDFYHMLSFRENQLRDESYAVRIYL